jgi:hypothetical protein
MGTTAATYMGTTAATYMAITRTVSGTVLRTPIRYEPDPCNEVTVLAVYIQIKVDSK